MKSSALRIVDERPTWQSRSVLVIAPGLWRMRNGHTARVGKIHHIPYVDGGTKKPAVYTVWIGACVECETPMSWTVNGCYAAVGKHRNDIVGAVE